MVKNSEKIFTSLKSAEPSLGLFDRIILAIRREQELRHTKRLAVLLFFLLVFSISLAPFSTAIFARQLEYSGITYFVSTAVSDLGTFFAFWSDYILAILESFPIAGLIVFSINIALALFTVRLFLHEKRFLLKYLFHKVSFN
jgi:glucan phosphoethanolaminetransferase (alkaline phosphatase superfamily)